MVYGDVKDNMFNSEYQKYVTFMEAVNSKKRFKYDGWCEYHHFQIVLDMLIGNTDEKSRNMVNSKKWIIEE